jgi:nucleoside-diphosphate-sugar epimerase
MITVLGAEGFIGRQVMRRLRRDGVPFQVEAQGDLGTVIDCAGVTVDFRDRALQTVDAHVARLLPLLERARRWVYLSSTRVYRQAADTAEDTPITVRPADPDDLYDISKICGEALLAASGSDVCILRLSNVYGPGMSPGSFLGQLVHQAARGEIELLSHPDSAKDYLAVEAAVEVIVRLAAGARHRVYNVASGRNIRHGDIAARLHDLTGCQVVFRDGAPLHLAAPIRIDRIRDELGFESGDLLADLGQLEELRG